MPPSSRKPAANGRKKPHVHKEPVAPVVEEVIKEVISEPEKVEIPNDIKTNSFVVLKKDGIDEVPDNKNPYFLLTSQGLYLHVRNALGRAIIKQKYWPKFLKDLKAPGQFTWDTTNIPAEICAQVVHFFRRIYDTHQTEAEVILLQHYETKEWAVYVPVQEVSGASVKSVIPEVKDIPAGYLIVGSIHSHCHFSAFHSGTDMGDADDMNGVHITIGMLQQDKPQIVAMVAVNGTTFTYQPEQIGDWTQLDLAEAPIEWDEKVIPSKTLVSGHKPQGYEAIEKFFKKPETKAVIPYTPPAHTTQPYQQQYQRPQSEYGMYGHQASWLADNDEDDWEGVDPEWIRYRNWLRGNSYGSEDRYDAKPASKRDAFTDDYFEDFIDKTLINVMLESNLITDEDLDEATANPAQAQTVEWWRALFLQKFASATSVLHDLGMKVEYSVRLASDQISTEDELEKRLREEGFELLVQREDGSIVIRDSLASDADDGPDVFGLSKADVEALKIGDVKELVN